MTSTTLQRLVYLQPKTASAQAKTDYRHSGIPMWCQKLMTLVILLLVAPLMLLVALFIRLESRGPVFFSQVRVGEFGRRFHCYKLRSMYLETDPKYRAPGQSDRQGVCKKYYHDPRITKVGKIIRKLSIDELPQLFNVLKGDMALVGPRPHLTSEYDEYDRNILPRLYCKPGITGLWQVSGRADIDFDQQLQLDKDYIRQQSAWGDVKILVATIPAVISAKGAY